MVRSGVLGREAEREPGLALAALELQGAVHPLGQLAGDGQAEAAARCGGRLAAGEPLEQPVAGEPPSIPGPSSDTLSWTMPSMASTATRTSVPPGVWRIALSTSARPICCTRCSSAIAAGSSCGRPDQHHPAAATGRQAAELAHQAAGGGGQVDRLVRDLDRAGIQPGQVEQIGGELGQPADLLVHLAQELLAGGLVEIGVVQQLQEAGQREQRRPQLVGGVGDEVLAGAVDARRGAGSSRRTRGPARPARRATGRRSAGRTPPPRSARLPPPGAAAASTRRRRRPSRRRRQRRSPAPSRSGSGARPGRRWR